ncbi:MAG: ATP-binding cassette domain-containing protein [Candidatus Schekmanbacteria bacterium]|nr:ATP-binding cassette domain-containing protein [Candidatus Schekmanbacteria bacterium]
MSIQLHQLSKCLDGRTIIDDVTLGIATGELFVLLGPSGSGKSTLLRMIAGLSEVDAGSVALHGRDVTHISPKDRNIGFVFQHYALFRNLSVADNVEFALRVRRVPKPERVRRREGLLALVGLAGFDHRYPHQLSGGQQQRVALARALASDPLVLLLDEPFGALDAKIRHELRQSLRRIQRELKLTTVFVTHDQEEAFELADRIGVLERGRLLEVGDPQELYLHPRSPFVSTFLGVGNLLVAESLARSVRLGPVELPVSSELVAGRAPRRVQVLVRPEDIELATAEPDVVPARALGRGVVEERAFVGAWERLRLRLPLPQHVRAVEPRPVFGDACFTVEALRPQHEAHRFPLAVGDTAWAVVRRAHVLAPATLRLLVESGPTAVASAARDFGERLATRLGAYHALLGERETRTNAREASPESSPLGAVTEGGAEGFDIAVLGLEPMRLGQTVDGLALIRHHLLLVSQPAPLPSRLLICVACGEPGKADVRFAERLAWQLGARATVLTVLPEGRGGEPTPAYVEQYLNLCYHALASRGVVAQTQVRRGAVLAEIRAELAEGGHDLLVVGAPVPSAGGRQKTFVGLLEQLLQQPPACPILIVRNQAGN